jgi:DNA-binding GntR family transcriptional regulator
VQQSHDGHVAELEIRQRIKTELEKQKSFEMDKKTLRRIVDNLKREGLLQTRDFKISIKPCK